MTMQRLDPFRDMRHFTRMINYPMWAAPRWGDPIDGEVDHTAEAWSIPMDVQCNERQLTVTAALPGFSAEDVDVSISPAGFCH